MTITCERQYDLARAKLAELREGVALFRQRCADKVDDPAYQLITQLHNEMIRDREREIAAWEKAMAEDACEAGIEARR